MHEISQATATHHSSCIAALLAGLLLCTSAAWADVIVFVTGDGSASPGAEAEMELAARALEAHLEAAGGVIEDELDLTPLEILSGSDGYSVAIRVDGLENTNGLTRLEFGAPLQLGSAQSPLWLSLAGPDVQLIARQGLSLPGNGTSVLEVSEGAHVISYGAIEHGGQGIFSGLPAPLAITGQGSRLSSIATAEHPDGGRIRLTSWGTDFDAFIGEGAVVEALSEIGPANGAGTVAIHGSKSMTVIGPGSELVAQYGFTIVGSAPTFEQEADIAVIDGAGMQQLESNEQGPGLFIKNARMLVAESGARAQMIDDIEIAAADIGGNQASFVNVQTSAVLATAGRIIIGSPSSQANGDDSGFDRFSNHNAAIELTGGGQLEAQEVVVNRNATLYGYGLYDRFEQETRDEFGAETVNADVTLNQGSLMQGAFDLAINGTLDASDGAVLLRVMEPRYQPLMTVSESVLFGEGSLIRVIVESIPAGGEILLDRYLVAGSYEFAPQFMLSAQLEPIIMPDLLASGEELLFRFSGLEQSFVYLQPEIVPELDGAAAPLAALLLFALGAIARERKGLSPQPARKLL